MGTALPSVPPKPKNRENIGQLMCHADDEAADGGEAAIGDGLGDQVEQIVGFGDEFRGVRFG